jgi:Cu(I)/Ag(I) efflux system membrane fusion protein
MFVEASVQSHTADNAAQQAPLVIPATAALFTGRRSVVYVELPEAEEPTYEARVVTLGPRMGDLYPVLAGLQNGERVVIHGAFALDADLQIQGGDSMMSLTDDDGAAADQAAHDQLEPKRKVKRAAPKKVEPETPTAPAGNHQQHMQGHQH